MPNESFWLAVERVLAGDDAGEDVEVISEHLLEADSSLGDQLQEALSSLDVSSLARAVRLSDGLGATEDAMIAVGCAVIAAGPSVYAQSVRDPDSLARPWDLSRGDLLLSLNPGVSLFDDVEPTARDGRCSINVSLGGNSELGWWYRQVADVIAHQQSRRAEKSQRWKALLARHDADHLIIHLAVGADRSQKVGKPRSNLARFLEVDATWNSPRSPFRFAELVETVLEAVALRLERT